jgi:hypothetical protein
VRRLVRIVRRGRLWVGGRWIVAGVGLALTLLCLDYIGTVLPNQARRTFEHYRSIAGELVGGHGSIYIALY